MVLRPKLKGGATDLVRLQPLLFLLLLLQLLLLEMPGIRVDVVLSCSVPEQQAGVHIPGLLRLVLCGVRMLQRLLVSRTLVHGADVKVNFKLVFAISHLDNLRLIYKCDLRSHLLLAVLLLFAWLGNQIVLLHSKPVRDLLCEV